MGGLAPVAFDIEASGLDAEAVITVAGFAHELASWICLNTEGRDVRSKSLASALTDSSEGRVTVECVTSEQALLEALATFRAETLDDDAHYLTAYNGETWNGGFDLPFLRSACHRNGVGWPFDDIAYADTMEAIQRFDTGDVNDLVGVYHRLIGEGSCDPFDDSAEAVTAFEDGNWLPLLKHNLADIERTRELAELAGRFVPSSDFSMKNLAPPSG